MNGKMDATNPQHLGIGVLSVLVFSNILVRAPLVGLGVVGIGFVAPLPKEVCGYLTVNAECGVKPALSIGFDQDIEMHWKVFMTAICILIPLGMEQSRWRGDLYDLEVQVSFYMSYHDNFVNKAIHVLCIPLILWSAIGMYSYTAPIFGQGSPAALDWSLIFTAVYATYYFRMAGQQSIIMGCLCFALVISLWIHAQSPYRPSINTLTWVHSLAWILQFWGHGVHEKRAPALFTNLSQALLMGPLFVFLEICFALGWAPGLYERVAARTELRIKKLRADDETKAAAKAKLS